MRDAVREGPQGVENLPDGADSLTDDAGVLWKLTLGGWRRIGDAQERKAKLRHAERMRQRLIARGWQPTADGCGASRPRAEVASILARGVMQRRGSRAAVRHVRPRASRRAGHRRVRRAGRSQRATRGPDGSGDPDADPEGADAVAPRPLLAGVCVLGGRR